MKVTLEFNLPEEKEAYDAAHRGHLYKTVIDRALHDIAENKCSESNNDAMHAYRRSWNDIHAGLDEHGLLYSCCPLASIKP